MQKKVAVSYLNNQRMRVSSRSKLKDSLIITGGPNFASKEKEASFKEYLKISKATLSPIRKLGSAALDLAYVAAGRCEAFWQRNLNYWDVAAGIILVREAGGFITDLQGGNNYLNNKAILATNAGINKEMIEILK